MGGRELLGQLNSSFDPQRVEIDDEAVLERLEPELREWWVEQFGVFVPANGGFFTPPQKEAIPLIDEGENALVCAPTGSGKCLKPDTPLVIQQNGDAKVVRAEELLDHRRKHIASVDDNGRLYTSDVQSYSLDRDDWTLTNHDAMVYSESYAGDLHRFHTTYGREVEVTPEHPLLVESGDGAQWKRAVDVSEGDRIGVPAEMSLPEHPVPLAIESAVSKLRDEYPVVIVGEESADLVGRLRDVDDPNDLGEGTIRRGLALADLSIRDVADRLEMDIATIHGRVTGENPRTGELLRLLIAESTLLSDREVVVKTETDRVSRFCAPAEIDPEIARLCAFVLADGFVRGQEGGHTHPERRALLAAARSVMRERFNVNFRHINCDDSMNSNGPFGSFFRELLGIQLDTGRDEPFPDWVLNATESVKRAFVSTFVALDAEVQGTELRLTQTNEINIEQLTYLLLSFGIFPGRERTENPGTNTASSTHRESHTLTIRGEDDLARFWSLSDMHQSRPDPVESSAMADGSGDLINRHRVDYGDTRKVSAAYENDDAFDDPGENIYEVVRRSELSTDTTPRPLDADFNRRPADEPVNGVEELVGDSRSRNVMWLEVREHTTTEYEGEIIDLSVPDQHNFVGGRGGLYLHNTLASFSAILSDLFGRAREDDLDNEVYCLYVSPLKSLANDIHRNLERPLNAVTERIETDIEVRHAIRHGDTSDTDRQAMLETTPHILNTTPETLAILLNSPKFKEKLRGVEYVIVDEIHSLAENKRGTHLSVSLERLERLCDGSPTRIGCSATVEPLDTIGEFLVGGEYHPDGSWEPRHYEIVDARFAREFDIELSCPTDDLVDTPPDHVTDRFYEQLDGLVREHTNTLVFTNTRSGAERVLHTLRERGPYDESNSGCHHGSLSKDRRQEIESKLKAGELDVVTTSTSLELGIDMPHVDLVVQVGSPKSVAALLQRVGRAGHQLGETVKGRVFALDRDELVECAVMLRKATEGFVDRVFLPENAHDVAAQHVYGMAINAVRPEAEVKEILRSAYPYRDYDDEAFDRLMAYLTADYPGLEDRNVYAKVWRDANDSPGGEHHHEAFDAGERLIGKRGRLARVIYMTNLGTIPDSFDVDVFVRGEDEWVGQLDEEYLDTLEPGDVFVLGGATYEYVYRRGSKVYVEPTNDRATVPSWFSERLPLSYDLGREVLAFQRALLDRLEAGGPPAVRAWLREFPLDANTVRAIARMFDEQVRYAGPKSVSTTGRLAIEETRDADNYRRRYHVHSNYGRRFNDGLSRLLAYRCAQTANANVQVAVADHGFTLAMPLNRKVDVAGLLRDLEPAEARAGLRAALDGTDLLKRYFRINATRSLMILKRYKGYEKSASQQQVSSEMLLGFARELDGFAVVEETFREILEDRLAVDAIEDVLGRVQSGDLEVVLRRVGSPSPRAFGLATLMASDVVLAEDESAVLREFHRRVLDEIDDDRRARITDA